MLNLRANEVPPDRGYGDADEPTKAAPPLWSPGAVAGPRTVPSDEGDSANSLCHVSCRLVVTVYQCNVKQLRAQPLRKAPRVDTARLRLVGAASIFSVLAGPVIARPVITSASASFAQLGKQEIPRQV
jgi:hypothetical protein